MAEGPRITRGVSVAIGSIVVRQYVQGAAYLLSPRSSSLVAWKYGDGMREALARKSRVAVPAKINKLLSAPPGGAARVLGLGDHARAARRVRSELGAPRLVRSSRRCGCRRGSGRSRSCCSPGRRGWCSAIFVLTCMPRMNHAPTLSSCCSVWRSPSAAATTTTGCARPESAPRRPARARGAGAFRQMESLRASASATRRGVIVVLVAAERRRNPRGVLGLRRCSPAIQEKEPAIRRHVYAIAAACRAGAWARWCSTRCSPGSGPRGKTVRRPGKAEKASSAARSQVLGQDFLSPALAASSFRNLVQRFLPFSGGGARPGAGARGVRGRTPGGRAWATIASRTLRGPVEGRPGLADPVALLNATWWRRQADYRESNLPVDAGIFNDTADVFSFHRLPIPASTAAHTERALHLRQPGGLAAQAQREGDRRARRRRRIFRELPAPGRRSRPVRAPTSGARGWKISISSSST